MARELHVLEAPGAPYEVVAAARGLAAAVVDRAVRDLAGNDGAAALRWLRSPHAEPWLDAIDVDRDALLEAIAPDSRREQVTHYNGPKNGGNK